MSLKACPDCGGNLGKDAIKCRCGWNAPGVTTNHTGARPGIPCAADPRCRYPGRLWIRTLAFEERICIDHYYIALSRDHSLGDGDTVPPKTKMLGVKAKAVAGE